MLVTSIQFLSIEYRLQIQGISAEVNGLRTLPRTVVPPLIRHHLLPRTDGFKQLH